jgi:hypothetical protein
MSEEATGRPALSVLLGGVLTAGLFEALTVLATQDRAVRTASPWQDDPYDAVVSLTQFTVPMLALVIAVRLVAWGAPGAPDREHQLLRASGAMTALVGLTAVFEWVALVRREHAASWGPATWVLVGGLAVVSGLTVALTVLLARRRRPRGWSRQWRHDWLGDVLLVCARVPALRGWVTPALAAWMRRRAMRAFVALSLLAAAVIVGALAVSEQWTNPLLITWALLVLTTSNLAFCVLSNRVAGFVARPTGTRHGRVAETAVVAGCVAVQVAMAFRDTLWSALVGGSLTSVPALAVLTFGVGLVIAALVAGVLLVRR